MDKTKAIGMFDSGIGGLTVMQQIVTMMPHEGIVYFGDTARIPYGEKSPEAIIRFSMENTRFLMQQNIKILVIACNTASSYAEDILKAQFSIPILGVIRPGAKKAVSVTRNERIGVLGTKATIRSGAYQREIHQLLPSASIFPIACPLFVPLVEEHFVDHAATKMIVHEYLKSVKDQEIDTLLLGCTHYPLLHRLIQDEIGDQVTLVDSASTCAEEVKAILSQQEMQSHQGPVKHQYFVSDDPEKFRQLGEAFLGNPILSVETVRF